MSTAVPVHHASDPATAAEHPDASYIKSDDLGLVIAKGMAVMYKAQPSNPVDFLAKWLLNYSNIQRSAVAAQAASKVQVKELRDKHDYQTTQAKKKSDNQQAEKSEKEAKIKTFYEKTMGGSSDLNDQLQELADLLKQYTTSTAVYIGKLVNPKKSIKETDDDRAHLDSDAEKVIHFLKATDGHQFLVDQFLKQGQGLTFDVFREAAEASGDKEASEDAPVEDESGPIKEKVVEEILPRSVFV